MLYTLGMRRGSRYARRGNASPYLDGIIPSTVFDLDVTQMKSYPGSGQLWMNMTENPADGAARSAYDFMLGNAVEHTLNDPTYNGTGKSAYWSYNGYQWHTLNGPQTNFLTKLHRSDNVVPFWAVICWKTPPSYSGANRLFGSSTLSSVYGIQMQYQPNGSITFSFSGNSQGNSISLNTILPTDQDNIIIFSFDPATSTRRSWINNRTVTESTITQRIRTEDSDGLFSIGSANGGLSAVEFGTRIYSLSMGNRFLTSTDALKIIDHMNARHGRIYV